MRVRALASMCCNANQIERRIEARYDAVEAITFVLNCNRHRHVHAVLAVGRTFIDVHDIGTNVSPHLERKRHCRVDTVRSCRNRYEGFNLVRRHVILDWHALPSVDPCRCQ